MSTDNEKIELEKYIDRLDGPAWKNLAFAQYDKSRSEERTHKEAMIDCFDKVIEVANKTLRRIDNL